jgi:hypothetical protein
MPARSRIKDLREAAADIALTLMPWQDIAGRYMMALGPNDKWLYRRIAVVVARQSGKTEIIKPRVLVGLRMGRVQLHIAQDRLRPRRSTFEPLADFLNEAEQRERYRIRNIRFANGQEQILCHGGGSYTIYAPTSGGARGGSFDDVYVDEAREFEDMTVESIIRPTTAARPNAQIMYFSSAGHDASAVLNDIRGRRDDDPRLAYLEWSAAPERDIGDREGWREANPALGITIDMDTLEDNFTSMSANAFETEHLCRWVVSMRPRLIDETIWMRAKSRLEKPVRPAMAVSVDPSGTRASAAIAWRQTDGTIGLKVVADVHGEPVNIDMLGPELSQRAMRMGATVVGFDPWTDTELARYFRNPKAVNGREFAGDCLTFVSVAEGQRLRWDDADAVAADLPWAVRKSHDSGAFMAVRAQDDKPITAVLAAIRAVGLVPAVAALPRVF